MAPGKGAIKIDGGFQIDREEMMREIRELEAEFRKGERIMADMYGGLRNYRCMQRCEEKRDRQYREDKRIKREMPKEVKDLYHLINEVTAEQKRLDSQVEQLKRNSKKFVESGRRLATTLREIAKANVGREIIVMRLDREIPDYCAMECRVEEDPLVTFYKDIKWRHRSPRKYARKMIPKYKADLERIKGAQVFVNAADSFVEGMRSYMSSTNYYLRLRHGLPVDLDDMPRSHIEDVSDDRPYGGVILGRPAFR